MHKEKEEKKRKQEEVRLLLKQRKTNLDRDTVRPRTKKNEINKRGIKIL